MEEERALTLIVARPGPLRDGVEALLASIHQIEVIGKVGRVSTAVRIAGERPLDLLLVDAGLLHGGVRQLVASCQNLHRGLRCVVLADNIRQVREARDLGVDAVFLQGFPADRFVRTVERLLDERLVGGH